MRVKVSSTTVDESFELETHSFLESQSEEQWGWNTEIRKMENHIKMI